MNETSGRDVDGRRLYSPHRFNALADGVFAIAMTLLALEIKIPESLDDPVAFHEGLGPLLGSLAVFAAAFFITAQYWIGHHRVMSYVHTVDGKAAGLTISALFGVAALPIAASLITNAARYPEAVAIAGGILIVTSLLSVRFYAHVLSPGFSDVDPLTRRRILVAPIINAAVYVLSVGVAFLLPVLGPSSAWATLLWLLLPLNRLVTNRIAGPDQSPSGD